MFRHIIFHSIVYPWTQTNCIEYIFPTAFTVFFFYQICSVISYSKSYDSLLSVYLIHWKIKHNGHLSGESFLYTSFIDKSNTAGVCLARFSSVDPLKSIYINTANCWHHHSLTKYIVWLSLSSQVSLFLDDSNFLRWFIWVSERRRCFKLMLMLPADSNNTAYRIATRFHSNHI